MSSLPEFFVDRVMTREGADDLVGDTVEWHEPNVHEAGIYRDRETGEAILVYAPYPGDTAALRRQVLDVQFSTTLRAKGTRNASRIFGFTTRSVVMKRESCSPASIAWEKPGAMVELTKGAEALGSYLRDVLPEVFEHDIETMEAVLPEWRITDDALWTSGVINQSSALPYHRDGANFDTWSAMPVVRRGMDGGHLRIPEYDLTVNTRDGWALWFNGYAILHGVTPMKPRIKDAYRYSIVYYAKRGMKDCHTYAVEVGEARKRRAERELRQIQAIGNPEYARNHIPTGHANQSKTGALA